MPTLGGASQPLPRPPRPTPPHPTRLKKLRTACLLMGFSLAQSQGPGARVEGQAKGGSQGNPVTTPNPAPERLQDLRQPLPCPELCFQVSSKVPVTLEKCSALRLLGKSTGLQSPVCCPPPLSPPHTLAAKKIGGLNSIFLCSFLSFCPHCPRQGHMFHTKATVQNDLKV